MLFGWFHSFREANIQTKYFILVWILFLVSIIISTVYVYGRLDYVRSYKTDETTTPKIQQVDIK